VVQELEQIERRLRLQLKDERFLELAGGYWIVERLCQDAEGNLYLHRGYARDQVLLSELTKRVTIEQAEALDFKIASGQAGETPVGSQGTSTGSCENFFAQVVNLAGPGIWRRTFPLSLVPYTRMTGRGKFSPRAQRYLQARSQFQWELKAAWRQEPWCAPVWVACRAVYPDRKVRDCDNVAKAVLDALTGVVLADDRLVRGLVIELGEGQESLPPPVGGLLELAIWPVETERA
jgi:Holliday junction resolvase RusA-like endonuclease